MKNYSIVVFFSFFVCWISNAQVGIGNTSPKAILDIEATNTATPANTDGILIPRVDAFPVTAPTAAQNGMLVFLTTDNTFYYWKNSTTSWVSISGAGAENINGLSDGKSDDDGVTDGSDIFFGINAGAVNNNGSRNIGLGFETLKANTTGYDNVAIGYQSLLTNILGKRNSALGSESLKTNTGNDNTAIGYNSMIDNNLGIQNTAIGSYAMFENDSGSYNSALGYYSLYKNSDGTNNIAIGINSLKGNISGSYNTAVGVQTLFDSSGTSNYNTALGNSSLLSNRNGSYNTAVGASSLDTNFDGNNNTALGYFSLDSNDRGHYNTSVGSYSLQSLTGNNADGNIALGYKAGDNLTFGVNNIIIGTEIDFPNSTGSNQLNIADIIYGKSVNGAVGGGSLGIDVINPTEKLEVNGAIKIGTTTTNLVEGIIRYTNVDFEGYTDNGWESLTKGWKLTGNSGTNPSTNFIGTTDNVDFSFRSNNTERMRLTTAGILKLITNSANTAQLKNDENFNSDHDNNLDFGDPVDAWMLSSQEGTLESSGIYGDRDFVTVWAPADSNRIIRFLDEDQWSDDDGDPYNNSAELAYVDASGQFVQASDKNRKQNIKNIPNAMQKISQINGYTYEYKLSSSEKQKGNQANKTSGVLAQELFEVLPEAVQISENGEYFVHYAGIIPLLIEALKEQQKEIDKLKQLEKRISRLEKMQ